MKECQAGSFTVQLLDEECYTPGSADNVCSYDHEHAAPGDGWQSAVGVRCGPHSAILLSPGVRGAVDSRSVVHADEAIYVACGSSVFSLSIPDLRLEWVVSVDFAACFGLHYCPEEACLVSHGEVEITRLALDGRVAWSATGRDIFTGDFEVRGDHIHAVDFNGDAYTVDLATGRTGIVG